MVKLADAEAALGGHRADAARSAEMLARAQADSQQLRRLLDECRGQGEELATRLADAETRAAAATAAARSLEAERDRAARDRAAAQVHRVWLHLHLQNLGDGTALRALLFAVHQLPIVHCQVFA